MEELRSSWLGRARAVLGSLGLARLDVAALVLLAFGALSGLGLLWWAQRPEVQPPEPSVVATAAPAEVVTAHGEPAEGLPAVGDPGTGETASGPVVVHVAGLVTNPGVQTLPAGARVADAVEAAGGALPDAWLDAVNLARPLSDGEQLLVPPRPGPGEPQVPPAPAAGPGSPGDAGGGVGPAETLDLNRASAQELEALPGIGPVMAARIVEHREANGPFTAVGQLRQVRGIGEKTFQELAPLVSV